MLRPVLDCTVALGLAFLEQAIDKIFHHLLVSRRHAGNLPCLIESAWVNVIDQAFRGIRTGHAVAGVAVAIAIATELDHIRALHGSG